MEIFNSKKQNDDYIELVKNVRDTFPGSTICAFIINGLKNDYVDIAEFTSGLSVLAQSYIDDYKEQANQFLVRLKDIQTGTGVTEPDLNKLSNYRIEIGDRHRSNHGANLSIDIKIRTEATIHNLTAYLTDSIEDSVKKKIKIRKNDIFKLMGHAATREIQTNTQYYLCDTPMFGIHLTEEDLIRSYEELNKVN